MKMRIVTILALGVSLTACSSIMNTSNNALSSAERHPITVDQQTVSLAIPIDSTLSGLTRQTLAELDQFMTVYRTRGHGPVTITSPSGTNRDIDGQQTAADVRDALHSFGLDYAQMHGATYRVGGRPDTVLVSFTRYVAEGPVCGVFTGETRSNLRNLPAPNFGCADQQNLAAMVADPADLTRMQDIGPGNGTQAAAAVRAVSGFNESSPNNGDE